jgi:hypothetical protein
VLYVILCDVCYCIVLYFIVFSVLFCPELHCSKMTPSINLFSVTNNNNDKICAEKSLY